MLKGREDDTTRRRGLSLAGPRYGRLALAAMLAAGPAMPGAQAMAEEGFSSRATNDALDQPAQGATLAALEARAGEATGTLSIAPDASALERAASRAREAGVEVSEERPAVEAASAEEAARILEGYEPLIARDAQGLDALAERARSEAAAYERAKAEYEEALAQWERGMEAYRAASAAHEEAAARYERDLAEWERAMAAYREDDAEWLAAKAAYEARLSAYRQAHDAWQARKSASEAEWEAYRAAKEAWDAEKARYDAAYADYVAAHDTWQARKQASEAAWAAYREDKAAWDSEKAAYDAASAKYASDKAAYDAARADWEARHAKWESDMAAYRAQKAAYDRDKAAYETDHAHWESDMAAYRERKAAYDRAKADWQARHDAWAADQRADAEFLRLHPTLTPDHSSGEGVRLAGSFGEGSGPGIFSTVSAVFDFARLSGVSLVEGGGLSMPEGECMEALTPGLYGYGPNRDGRIALPSDSLLRYNFPPASSGWYPGYQYGNVADGSKWLISGMGRTTDGRRIDAVIELKRHADGMAEVPYHLVSFTRNPDGSMMVAYRGIDRPTFSFSFQDEKGQPLRLALTGAVGDVDGRQMQSLSFNGATALLAPPGSGLELRDGDWGRHYEDTTGWGANELASAPFGSFAYAGVGSAMETTHSVQNWVWHESSVEWERGYQDSALRGENGEFDAANATWYNPGPSFSLFGKAATGLRVVNEPEPAFSQEEPKAPAEPAFSQEEPKAPAEPAFSQVEPEAPEAIREEPASPPAFDEPEPPRPAAIAARPAEPSAFREAEPREPAPAYGERPVAPEAPEPAGEAPAPPAHPGAAPAAPEPLSATASYPSVSFPLAASARVEDARGARRRRGARAEGLRAALPLLGGGASRGVGGRWPRAAQGRRARRARPRPRGHPRGESRLGRGGRG